MSTPLTPDTLLDSLLISRGITTREDADIFLNPNYVKHTHDPFLLKDAEKAAHRIVKAIDGGEKIVVYSDYDTDGIPGGVLFHDFLKKAGATHFTNYIPHRHDEGFGLNSDAVQKFADEKTALLITIDCGIADIIPVTEATAAGIDVIIIDHHIPATGVLPPAYAIVNPKQADCTYPEKMLCGSGVAWKLIQAILLLAEREDFVKKYTNCSPRLGIKEGTEKWLLDMVGIATLSDMVPLTGENRVLAHYGLMVLKKSSRPGLIKLFNRAGVKQAHITEDDIGFTLGPRINAASRMGVPMDAFNLLSTDDEGLADTYAKHLEEINNERKVKVAGLVKELKKMMKERFDDNVPAVIVLGNPQWRPSLLGLAANTLADEYDRPVFLWGRDGDGIIKGSCRGGDDLVSLMTYAQEMSVKESADKDTYAGVFLQYGGHAKSGGFAVSNEKIHHLLDVLNNAYEMFHKEKVKVSAHKTVGSLDISNNGQSKAQYVLGLNDVSWETYNVLEKLAPFGVANPKPVFMFKSIEPKEIKSFGKEKNHLELIFERVNGKKVSAIGFFMTPEDWSSVLRKGSPLTLLATLEKSMFRSFPELRLRIIDIIPA